MRRLFRISCNVVADMQMSKVQMYIADFITLTLLYVEIWVGLFCLLFDFSLRGRFQ